MTSTSDKAMPLSRLSLNLISVGTEHPFEKILDTCVEHGIEKISPWQTHYDTLGANRAAALLQARSIQVETVCRLSEFGAADSAGAWQSAVSQAMQIIDDAAILGARTITVIGGGLPAQAKDIAGTRERIRRGIEQVLPTAKAAGITLALEPLHPMVAAERGAINTVAQAVSLARELGDGAGVMIDTYNTWWDPALADSIASASGLIAGLQMADWLIPTTDLAFDRGMPGDGVIDFKQLRQWVETASYQGPVEVEVLSNRWSALPIEQVVRTVVERFEQVC